MVLPPLGNTVFRQSDAQQPGAAAVSGLARADWPTNDPHNFFADFCGGTAKPADAVGSFSQLLSTLAGREPASADAWGGERGTCDPLWGSGTVKQEQGADFADSQPPAAGDARPPSPDCDGAGEAAGCDAISSTADMITLQPLGDVDGVVGEPHHARQAGSFDLNKLIIKYLVVPDGVQPLTRLDGPSLSAEAAAAPTPTPAPPRASVTSILEGVLRGTLSAGVRVPAGTAKHAASDTPLYGQRTFPVGGLPSLAGAPASVSPAASSPYTRGTARDMSTRSDTPPVSRSVYVGMTVGEQLRSPPAPAKKPGDHKRRYVKRASVDGDPTPTRGRLLHFCPICSKGFKDKYSVNVHVRTHTGEKPFHCQLCTKSFRQKAHLAKHVHIHTSPKPAPGKR